MQIDPKTLRGDWSYPTRVRFGPGRIAELAQACRELGMARPLLVTDPGLATQPGSIPDVKKAKPQRPVLARMRTHVGA